MSKCHPRRDRARFAAANYLSAVACFPNIRFILVLQTGQMPLAIRRPLTSSERRATRQFGERTVGSEDVHVQTRTRTFQETGASYARSAKDRFLARRATVHA